MFTLPQFKNKKLLREKIQLQSGKNICKSCISQIYNIQNI